MTTAADGKRYKTKLYNLSMILAIGYISALIAEKLALDRYSEFHENSLKEEALKADAEDITYLEQFISEKSI